MKSKIKIFDFKWGSGDAEWVAAENKEFGYALKIATGQLTGKDIIEISKRPQS